MVFIIKNTSNRSLYCLCGTKCGKNCSLYTGVCTPNCPTYCPSKVSIA